MTVLEPTAPVREESFNVHSYEVDLNQRLLVEAACRRFQEIAWNHAEALGVGYHRLQEENRIWVLVRLRLRVERFPEWGQAVKLRTWPRAAKLVIARRDFELLAADGARLIGGTSAWLVLDQTSRKPQRLDKLLAGVGALPETGALEGDPEKLEFETPPGAGASERHVNYSDIDVYGHVNNSRYIGWLLDSYPIDFHRAHQLRTLEINYVGETVPGDCVSVAMSESAPGEYSHSIAKANGQLVCLARISWR